jgi:signal transduction histidine kinase/ligand-binding sensor domain-containing protein
MVIKDSIWVLNFVLFVFVQGIAQTFGPPKNYTLDDGLPSLVIYSIAQDNNGFIWLGLEAGLSKFNGHSFENYSVSDGLSYNEVVSIQNDRKGRLWLNSLGKISYIENGEIKSLDINVDQNLFWNFNILFTNSMAWIVNGGTKYVYTTNFKSPKELPESWAGEVISLIDVYDNSIIYYSDEKILQIDEQYEITVIHEFDKENYRGVNQRALIIEDDLFFSNHDQLFSYNFKTKKTKRHNVPFNDVRSIKQAYPFLYFIYTSGGYRTYNVESKTLGDLHFDSTYISDLLIDNQKNLWISTLGKGLFFYHKTNSGITSLDQFELGELKELETIFIDGDDLWLGTNRGKLFKISDEGNAVFQVPIQNPHGVNRVLDIDRQDDEKLIIATDSGIFHIENDQIEKIFKGPIKQISLTDTSAVINSYANSMNIPFDCLEEIKTHDFSFRVTVNSLDCIYQYSAHRAFATLVDSKGNVWIDNSVNGLIRISGKERFHYKTLSPVFRSHIKRIYELESGVILAATVGSGLIAINNDSYNVFTIADGLPSNVCNDVISNGDQIYVATNQGIGIMHFRNDNSIELSGLITTEDGLLSNNIKNLAFKNDSLYCTSENGLNIVDLASYKSGMNSKVVIEKLITTADRVLDKTEGYVLEAGEDDLVISYSDLIFNNKQGQGFAYILEGFEKDWKITNDHEVRYTNLDPGNYIFKVQRLGISNKPSYIDEDSNLNVAEIAVEVKPSFSQSTFAKILLMCGFAAMIFLISRYILNSRTKRNLSALVKERTKELNQKIEEVHIINQKLKLSNQELQEYAHVTSHDLKSPLRTINSFVSLLSKRNTNKFDSKDKEYIKFIEDAAFRMDQVVHDLLNLSKVSIHSDPEIVDSKLIVKDVINDLDYDIYKKKVDIQVEGEFPELKMEATNLKQLFQNLISNAIKYNKNETPKVTITARSNSDNYLFSIQDNGIGFEKKYEEEIFKIFKRLHGTEEFEGTGIGLAICKKVIDKYQGSIWCHSVPGGGSSFFFKLPKNLGPKYQRV